MGCYYDSYINRFSFLESGKCDSELARVIWGLFIINRRVIGYNGCYSPPVSLFIEPFRTCNLSCKYCYVKNTSLNMQSNTVQLNDIKNILDAYPSIQSVLVFGGDIFTNKEFFYKLLHLVSGKQLTISTNGILLPVDAQEIALKEGVRLSLQVSIEPEKWGQRVDASRKHQNRLLSNLQNKVGNLKVNYRVTISVNACRVSLYDFIEYVHKLTGSGNFTINYWHELSEDYNEGVVNDWIQQSIFLLEKDFEYYKDKVIFTMLQGVVGNLFKYSGVNYFNCNAGYASISIGPDGRIYGCHEKAIIEDGKHIISDVSNRFAIVKKYMDTSFYANTCYDCRVKFFCGGICFVNPVSRKSVCKMLPKVFDSFLPYASKYLKSNIFTLVQHGANIFNNAKSLNLNMEQLYIYKNFVHGGLSLEEDIVIYNKLVKGGMNEK